MQTRMRLLPPLMTALTDCRFGSNRRALTLFAWLCCRPTTGPFPHNSHRFAIKQLSAFRLPDSQLKAVRRKRHRANPKYSGRSRGLSRCAIHGVWWRGASRHAQLKPTQAADRRSHHVRGLRAPPRRSSRGRHRRRAADESLAEPVTETGRRHSHSRAAYTAVRTISVAKASQHRNSATPHRLLTRTKIGQRNGRTVRDAQASNRSSDLNNGLVAMALVPQRTEYELLVGLSAVEPG